MNKLLLVVCLLSIFGNAHGQWYVKKYNVPDIYQLSGPQLNESLQQAESNVVFSGITAGLGGFIIIITQYGDVVKKDNPSLMAEILGYEGMKTAFTLLGAGVLAGGSVGTIIYLGRIMRINKVLLYRDSNYGALHLSPTIIPGYNKVPPRWGVSLTCNF